MSASAVTSLDQNKQLVIRWFEEVWNQGNRDTIAQLFAPDGILHDGDRIIRGPAEFEKFYDRLRAVLSNFKISPVLALAEGDLACVHWFSECKHIATAKTCRSPVPPSSVSRTAVSLKPGKTGTPPAWPFNSPANHLSNSFNFRAFGLNICAELASAPSARKGFGSVSDCYRSVYIYYLVPIGNICGLSARRLCVTNPRWPFPNFFRMDT